MDANAALKNLRSISSLASRRDDRAIFILASLLEGMTYLHLEPDDMVEKVQSCIAQASKYQLDPSSHIPQLDFIALLLDVSCCLYQKSGEAGPQLGSNEG